MNNNSNNDILVSVVTLAYNHRNYIRQCIDGILMQKTSFTFELLIHDDASTDGTSEIIKEYEKAYPDIVKPIFQTENQYSKGVSIGAKFLYPKAKGKYIAECEGDDYWTDPLKLQKQVDFLESNNDFSFCFHPVKIFYHEKELFNDDYTRDVPSETTIIDLAKGNYIHTLSIVFRNNSLVFSEINKIGTVATGDYVLHMLNAKYGKIKKIPDCMGVYRLSEQGVWGLKRDYDRLPLWNEMLIKIMPFFNESVQNELHKQYLHICDQIFLCGENKVRSSYAYRIGKIIIYPLSWLRKILRKMKFL